MADSSIELPITVRDGDAATVLGGWGTLTVLLPALGYVVEHVQVVRVLRSGSVYCEYVDERGRRHATTIESDQEGIRWIRGHHHKGSNEVLALRAAWALTETA